MGRGRRDKVYLTVEQKENLEKISRNGHAPAKVDGATEAQIIALCCSDPPEGRGEWTMRLLTAELKKRQIITEISRETVRRTLKKPLTPLENRTILYSRTRSS